MEKTEKIKSIIEYKPGKGRKSHKMVYDVQVEGNDTFVYNGVVIHNSRVEFGQPEFHYTGSQNVKIKKHVIHTKEGVKTIKAHTRTYVNKRLVRIRPHQDWSRGEIEASYGMRIPGNVTNVKIYGAPIFVVMSRIPARQGQFFFSRAIFEGIKKLPDDMKWSLAKIGKVG